MLPHRDSGIIRLVNVDLRISLGCNLKNPGECDSLNLTHFNFLPLVGFGWVFCCCFFFSLLLMIVIVWTHFSMAVSIVDFMYASDI